MRKAILTLIIACLLYGEGFAQSGNAPFVDGAPSNQPALAQERSELVAPGSPAAHCVRTQAQANTVEMVWFFQTSTCNGPVPDINTRPRNTGALLLKTHRDTDWTLLGAFTPVRGNWFQGWNSGYWNHNSGATGIHHPRGEFKRIHVGTKDQDTSCFTADGLVQSNQQWRVTAALGAARPGSSGSPAFDADHRVRGTMSCGPGGMPPPLTCPPNEWKTYGRFDAFFFIGRWYLFEMANPAIADRNFIGDPGEEGDRERGTPLNPFNTVLKATHCVPSGGVVLIRPGNYNERFRLWRPMILAREGSAGVVTIGAP